jgi:hypothetical protein
MQPGRSALGARDGKRADADVGAGCCTTKRKELEAGMANVLSRCVEVTL